MYIDSIRCVTAKPPKMFTEAKTTARKPKKAATPPAPVAISAPTMMTLEIALVTDRMLEMFKGRQPASRQAGLPAGEGR